MFTSESLIALLDTEQIRVNELAWMLGIHQGSCSRLIHSKLSNKKQKQIFDAIGEIMAYRGELSHMYPQNHRYNSIDEQI